VLPFSTHKIDMNWEIYPEPVKIIEFMLSYKMTMLLYKMTKIQ